MPEIKTHIYKPLMKRITEKGVLKLLGDVRKKLAGSSVHFEEAADYSLTKILDLIEKGDKRPEYPHHIQVGPSLVIDLSMAADLITQYRLGSEAGCPSCKNLKMDRTGKISFFQYCGKHENFLTALADRREHLKREEGNPDISNKFDWYWNKGCEDYIGKFSKTIEQILEEAETA